MVTQELLHEPRFWYTIAFILFFVLFGRRLWRPLASMLDARAAAVRLELDEAARLRREAERMLVEARREREAALAEAEAMLAHARQEAVRIAESSRREAEASARRRERMARDRIAASRRAATDEVRAAAAAAATEAARAVLAGNFSPEQDAALVDRAIASLPAALRHAA